MSCYCLQLNGEGAERAHHADDISICDSILSGWLVCAAAPLTGTINLCCWLMVPLEARWRLELTRDKSQLVWPKWRRGYIQFDAVNKVKPIPLGRVGPESSMSLNACHHRRACTLVEEGGIRWSFFQLSFMGLILCISSCAPPLRQGTRFDSTAKSGGWRMFWELFQSINGPWCQSSALNGMKQKYK